MIFKLTASTVFPEGTTVYAYPRDAEISGTYPIGDAVSSGVMSATSVLLGDLDSATTYVAYALVNGTHRYVHFRTDPTTIPDAQALGAINVTSPQYGAVAGTDCTTAVLNAKTDADALGVPVYFPGAKHNYLLSNTTPLAWTDSSYPIGDGYAQSVIQFTAAGGGFSFGDPTADGFGSSSGLRGRNVNGLSLWGGPAAGSEVCVNPLKITQWVQSVIANVEVKYAAGDGIVVEQSQNCNFHNVNAQDNLGSGLVLDRGTGGHGFFRCEFSDNHAFNVRIQESAHRSSGYQRPSDIHFYASIIERLRRMTDPNAQASLLISAGNVVSFHGCNLVATSGTLDGAIVEIAPLRYPTLSTGTSFATNLKFTDCWFFGSQNNVAIDAFRIYGVTEITFAGHNVFQNPGDADRGYGGAGGAMFALDDSGTPTINVYGTLDSSYNVRWRNLPITTVTTAAVTLPTGTIAVSDATHLPNSGTVASLANGTITYTGKTGTTLTGCTGGTGTLAAKSYLTGATPGSLTENSIVRGRSKYPLAITRTSTGDDGLVLGVDGESGSRVLIKGSGLYLGDGSSFNTGSGFVLMHYHDTGIMAINGGLRLSSSTSGHLSLVRQPSPPATPIATEAALYLASDSSKTRLAMLDENGVEVTIKSTNIDAAFASITPGGTPWTYHNTTFSRQSIIVRGGTVSLIEYSRDGAAFEDVGVTAGKFEVERNDYLRVTYSVTPTLRRISQA